MNYLKFTAFAFVFGLISCTTQNSIVQKNSFDSDLDGLHDERDACPNQAGSLFNLGCPEDANSQLVSMFDESKSTDSDLDGVENNKDECPLIYGSPFNMGCPFTSEKK